MAFKRLQACLLASIAVSGICMASAVAQQLPRAGGLYILEATNASFASAQQVTLSGVAPATAYMVGYPYRDAGVLDTAALIQDPTFSPQNTWLAGPVGTLFGTGINATAVLFLVNDIPVYDYPTSTLTLNITVISDPAYLKFSDGIARQTYQNALTPNRFARVVEVTAQVGPGGMLTNVALFLDVDQTQIVPASVPPPPASIVNSNNNNNINNNNNNNNGGAPWQGFPLGSQAMLAVLLAGTITNNNGVGPFQSPPTTGGGITNNNNNGGSTTNNNNNGGSTITNNNGAAPAPGSATPTLTGFAATPTIPSTAPTTTTNNNVNSGGSGTTNNNNNGPGGTPVPSAPGQVPAPGTYNVITTVSDCNGQTSTQYSYVPGLHGISRNNNNNCG